MAVLQQPQVAQLLGTTDIFSKLKPEHLTAIANACKVMRYDEGSVIVKQDDAGDELFIIALGKVAVIHEETEIGSEQLVTTLETKQCFGETSLLAEAPRSATIKALEDTACVVLAKRSFESVLTQIPEVTLEVSRFLAARLHHQCQLTGFRFVSELKYDPDIYGMFDASMLRRLKAVPLSIKDGTMTVAFTNPNRAGSVKELRGEVPGMAIDAVVCSHEDYEAFVRRHHPRKRDDVPLLLDGDVSAELCLPNGEPLAPPLSSLLRDALNRDVNQLIIQGDELLTPQGNQLERFSQVASELEQSKLETQLQSAFFQRAQGAEVNTAILTMDPNILHLRVSRVETTRGPRFSLNILKSETTLPPLSDVIPSSELREKVYDALLKPGQLVLVAGPARSGRTQTGHMILHSLKEEKGVDNLATLEQSPAATLRDIPQVAAGEQWTLALEALLMQNPTAVMLSERAISELPEIVKRLDGTTSALVCVRSNDALQELADAGLDESSLESVSLVLQQRLVPRLCEQCRESYTPSSSVINQLQRFHIKTDGTFYRSPGCVRCHYSGTAGKMPVIEGLTVNSIVREMLTGGRTGSAIRKAADSSGLVVGYQHSAEVLMSRGEISPSACLKFFAGLA